MTKTPQKKCYLCSCTEHLRRPGKVRDDSTLEILECKNCGLVFLTHTELPDGFYEKSGMHGEELIHIEEWLRQLERDDDRCVEYLKEAMTNRDILDFGCGPGGFLIKARSKTRMVMGIELESRLQTHFQKINLNVVQHIQDLPFDQKFDMITAFHVVEHLEDPADMLRQLATKLLRSGKIIIEILSSALAALGLTDTLIASFSI